MAKKLIPQLHAVTMTYALYQLFVLQAEKKHYYKQFKINIVSKNFSTVLYHLSLYKYF